MATWHGLYERRMRNSGGSISGSLKNSTKKFVEEKFSTHPSFTYVDVEGIRTGVRIVDGNRSSIKKLLFYPETEINIGDLVEINEKIWLITDYLTNEPSELFPSAEIKLCNNYLRWTDADGVSHNVPCVIENQVSGYQEVDTTRHGVFMPDDTLIITVKYTVATNQIKYFQRFMFDNNRTWRVHIIDNISKMYNNGGLIQFLVKAVPLRQDEVPDDVTIPGTGYFVWIIGGDEVETNTSALYDAVVYLNGEMVDESDYIYDDISWSVNDNYLATISNDGVLTTYGEAGDITITATIDSESVSGDKDVEIVVPGSWW